MAVAPGTERKQKSGFTLALAKSKVSGRKGRSGGGHEAHASEAMRLLRLEPGLVHGIDPLRRGAEKRHPLLISVIEEDVAVGMEGRAVIEQQRRLRGERRSEPVPHHPA